MRTTPLGSLILGASLLFSGCSGDSREASEEASELASADGTPLELRFKSEVVAKRGTPVKNAAIAQLEYLQGVLTTRSHANAQFRFVDVSDVTERVEGEKVFFTYAASVAAIFPEGTPVPRRYDLALPRDVTTLEAFNEKYDGRCGTNEYGRATFWHDFNPSAAGCTLDTDVVRARASVRRHPLGTTDKYPEYDLLWADDSLDILAVYGSIATTTDDDNGARDREAFIEKVKGSLTGARRQDQAPNGSIIKHSILTGTARVGGQSKKVRLATYFVTDPSYAGPEFYESYGAESERADIIVYSGHSGLGVNIAKLSEATRPQRGKYQIVFFNGCQSFGYLGPSMHERRIAQNGRDRDPHGTKFLDVIVTALPAYAEFTPTEQVLYDAALERTKGWGELLRLFREQQAASHLTTVFGEDDNSFRP